MKSDDAILDFAFRHGLSVDWLVRGDLCGRLRMAKMEGRGIDRDQ
jgi:hypothetical protein